MEALSSKKRFINNFSALDAVLQEQNDDDEENDCGDSSLIDIEKPVSISVPDIEVIEVDATPIQTPTPTPTQSQTPTPIPTVKTAHNTQCTQQSQLVLCIMVRGKITNVCIHI